MGDKKIKVKPKRRFFLLSIFILLIGLGGINSQYNGVLIYFSLLLSCLGVSGIYSKWNLIGIKVELSPPFRVFCCEQSFFTLKIINTTRLPKYALWLEIQGNKIFVGDLKPGQELSMPVSLKFSRRGLNRMPGIRIFSMFPLGVVEREIKQIPPREVLVYPKIYDVYPHFPEDYSGYGKSVSLRAGNDEFLSLRENQEAEFRKIDWKSFARTEKILEKVFSSSSGKKLLIVLDPYGKGKELEENISLIASIGYFLMKREMEHLIIAGMFEGSVDEKNLDLFLRNLAFVKFGGPEQSRELALRIKRDYPGITVFAAVSSPDSPLREILQPKELVFV